MPPRRPTSDSSAANALAIAAAGVPPVAAGAATAGTTGAGLVAAARLTENAVRAIMAVVRRLSSLRVVRASTALATTAAPAGDIQRVIDAETDREAEFRRRSEARVRLGMRLALNAPDASVRAAAVEAVVRREQRYARQRAIASGERLFSAVEREALRRDSPRGAFWELGPTAEHTPDCLAMAGKFWPWPVLDRLHIPMHVGCRCRLRSYGEALAAGLLRPGAVPSLDEARRLAAPIIAWVEREKAMEDAAVAELLIRQHLVRSPTADPNRIAATPLKVDAELVEIGGGTEAEPAEEEGEQEEESGTPSGLAFERAVGERFEAIRAVTIKE